MTYSYDDVVQNEDNRRPEPNAIIILSSLVKNVVDPLREPDDFPFVLRITSPPGECDGGGVCELIESLRPPLLSSQLCCFSKRGLCSLLSLLSDIMDVDANSKTKTNNNIIQFGCVDRKQPDSSVLSFH